ncbi:hypothetical protein PFICI_03754 [Pestalotiopsis fici W106-1]|uniref:SAP domain-containing protein n=1 Tax=Pestalotiopsis fici (strain W106-1 / CGMCC3.15140) TaxID=1229662 RepID=W3XIB5_PESFW|nr:uncharacterized protein PFICI_03754 [Pestalotiopsis fici W106-1]ETS85729.1 hypothetical protein PFICI_03754 [Pestalotiopsis fici W106-1]
MSSSSNPHRAEIEQFRQKVSLLLVKQLQNVCSIAGLRTSGIKAELQRRIMYGKGALLLLCAQGIGTRRDGSLG